MSEAPPDTSAREEPTLGALVHDMTQQMSTLVRDEMRLAQAEMTQKGKRAGVGIGLFSAAGLLAFFGLAATITTVILALSLALPAWLSALIVAVVLFAFAGAVALQGKNSVQKATPAKPEQAIEGLKEDVATVKGRHV
jgi:Putative Actinobacterial Holin-X, holin superfamily III